MDFIVPVLQVIGGLFALYFGGNFLVNGATGIAAKLNISPVVIGLTVVAFGTSAPELFVSATAALGGKPDLALGNVIGSNIVNILLILGIVATFMITPISRSIIRRDIPIMLAASLVLPLAMLNFAGPDILRGDSILRWEGAVLAALLILYVVFLLRSQSAASATATVNANPQADSNPRNHPNSETNAETAELAQKEQKKPMALLLGMVGLGIVGLAFGADFLVDGASWLAIHAFQASERVVGITIVAFGTSLPELVTSIVAMAKKEADISVGNIVGSNILNILFVLGISALLHPVAGDLATYGVDIIIMIAAALLLGLASAVWKQLNRAWGLLFLAGYAAYLVYLFQA